MPCGAHHTAYPEAKSLIIIIQTSGALCLWCRKEHLMPGSEKEEVGAITDLRSLLCHWSISFSGHAVEPSEEEEESTTNEVFYAGYPGGETCDWSSLFLNYIFGELFTSSIFMIVWSAHGILSELDQVNNANSVIIFFVDRWSVRVIRVVWSVRVVQLVQLVHLQVSLVRVVRMVKLVHVVHVVQVIHVVQVVQVVRVIQVVQLVQVVHVINVDRMITWSGLPGWYGWSGRSRWYRWSWLALMICIQKMYGLHGLNHQIIDGSSDVTLVTD